MTKRDDKEPRHRARMRRENQSLLEATEKRHRCKRLGGREAAPFASIMLESRAVDAHAGATIGDDNLRPHICFSSMLNLAQAAPYRRLRELRVAILLLMSAFSRLAGAAAIDLLTDMPSHPIFLGVAAA